jgi:hypothetical protein
VVPITTAIEGSKMCLEYHIFHHTGLTFILVGVPLHALLRGTDNGECLKMVVEHQEFLTCFAHAVNHAAEDELQEDLLQQVMATTLEEELSPPAMDPFNALSTTAIVRKALPLKEASPAKGHVVCFGHIDRPTERLRCYKGGH